MWFVYFLKATGRNWYYVGSTDNIARRMKEHNSGKVISTKHHIPLHLVYTKELPDENSARTYERRIKRKRLLKEQIIRTIKERCRIV